LLLHCKYFVAAAESAGDFDARNKVVVSAEGEQLKETRIGDPFSIIFH